MGLESDLVIVTVLVGLGIYALDKLFSLPEKVVDFFDNLLNDTANGVGGFVQDKVDESNLQIDKKLFKDACQKSGGTYIKVDDTEYCVKISTNICLVRSGDSDKITKYKPIPGNVQSLMISAYNHLNSYGEVDFTETKK